MSLVSFIISIVATKVELIASIYLIAIFFIITIIAIVATTS